MSIVKKFFSGVVTLITFSLSSQGQTFTPVTTGPMVQDGGASRSVTWIDYDRDGYLDLFVTNFNGGNNVLYHNDGPPNFTFTRMSGLVISQAFAPSAASTWGDYDNDGYPDAFVANWGGVNNLMYHNNGDGTFSSISSGDMVNDHSYSATCSWADYDNDGLLDLVVTNSGTPSKNFLYHNLGNGTFETITSSPVVTAIGPWYGCSWFDYDGDGDLDLIITPNGGPHIAIFKNMLKESGTATFVRITTGTLVTTSGTPIGMAWGDYDNDGKPDLYVTNFNHMPNFLFHNDGGGNFTKIDTGLVATEVGDNNSAAWADVDNDGDLDLVVTEGWRGGSKTNTLYKNMLMETGLPAFQKITTGPLVTDAGYSFGLSWGDYDDDGFPDLYVAKSFGGSQDNTLFHNDGNGNHWLKLDCFGTVSNRSAIGTTIRAKATINGTPLWQTRMIEGQSNFYGQNLQAHFGLGDATTVDSLIILWPSGSSEIFTGVPSNRHLAIAENDSTPPSPAAPSDGMANHLPVLTMQWHRGTCGGPYHLQMSTDSTFGGSFLVNDSTGGDTVKLIQFTTNNATYFWRLKSARSMYQNIWSPTKRFTNAITSPPVPSPVSPLNASVNRPILLHLDWSAASGATSYRCQLSGDSLFSGLIEDDSLLATTANLSPLANLTTYYWRVRGDNFAGSSAYSPVQSFTTIIDTPSVPSPQVPADNAVNQPLSLNLSWTPASRAATYNLQVATDSLFGAIVISKTDTPATASVGGLSFYTQYFWRVSATNIGGTSPRSNVSRFRTMLGPLTLVAPENGADHQPPNLFLRWNRVGGASSYHLEVSTDSTFATLVVNDSLLADSSTQPASLSNQSTYYWRVEPRTLISTGTWSMTRSFTVRPPTIVYTVDPRWNLISLPLAVADPRKSVLFPAASTSAYAFETGSYAPKETLSTDVGYWIKFPAGDSISLSGDVKLIDTISVVSGWNLIGTTTNPIASASVASAPDGILQSYFFGYNGHYSIADTLRPMRGYWTKSSANGKIILGAPPATMKKSEPDFLLTKASKLTFTDANGHEQTLYLAGSDLNHTSRPEKYEMPPPPPAEVFDIRFASNRFLQVVENEKSIRYPIILSGVTYPLKVSWDMVSPFTNAGLSVDGKVMTLSGNGQSTFTAQNQTIALVFGETTEIPSAFSVGQNYPNPFNPSTTIAYGLHEESDVSLVVYDLLGREIRTLVNAHQGAGKYNIVWDAADNSGTSVASGVYLYRFKASYGDKVFIDIKKLTVLK